MGEAVDFGNLRRYSRQLLIPEIALAGQQRLANARVLCVGVGGLGSPVALYLAAAGIGCLGLIDDDVVDVTNLQRQVLFSQAEIGEPKVAAAARRLQALNPHVQVETLQTRLTATNALELFERYDLVIDGSDNFTTRYLVNDACVLSRRSNIFASIYRFEAQITVFAATGAPCYRCIYPEAPPADERPSCAEGGVLGAIAGMAGTWQAAEAVKMLLNIGEPLHGRLLRIDALRAQTRELRVTADPACVVCGADPQITQLLPARYAAVAGESVSSEPPRSHEIGPADVADELASGTLVLDVREPHEVILGLLPGTVHIPYSQLPARIHELDLRKKYLVACRIGMKSNYAFARLRDAGFTRLVHLRGGILGYAAYDEQLDAF